MDYSELQKSSLAYLLNETGMQQAEGRVRSISLLEEMSLIGFIPYTKDFTIQSILNPANLNSRLFVAPYFVKFSQDTPAYPYFKRISMAEGKQYRVDGKLYIDPILSDILHNTPLQYVNPKMPFDGNQLLQLLKKRRVTEDLLIKNEDKTYDYIGREGEYELSCGLENIVSISNSFLCLCSYMNKVTGLPSYTVLTAKDTIRMLPENEDE